MNRAVDTQTAVLRMFDVKMAVFKMKLLGVWSKEGACSASCATCALLLCSLRTCYLLFRCRNSQTHLQCAHMSVPLGDSLPFPGLCLTIRALSHPL